MGKENPLHLTAWQMKNEILAKNHFTVNYSRTGINKVKTGFGTETEGSYFCKENTPKS